MCQNGARMERLYERIKRNSLKVAFSFETKQKETYIGLDNALVAFFVAQRVTRSRLVCEPFEGDISGRSDNAKLADMRHAGFADKIEFVFWIATCKMASYWRESYFNLQHVVAAVDECHIFVCEPE